MTHAEQQVDEALTRRRFRFEKSLFFEPEGALAAVYPERFGCG